MINFNTDICRLIKEARREAGISQSDLAREVGCKQSALSMFEQGAGTKLSEETVRKLAARFGIEIKSTKTSEKPEECGLEARAGQVFGFGKGTGYCPNPSCPTNSWYEVGGRRLAKPDREAADPVGGKYCAYCGEILERRCPSCGSPVHSGAICSICGDPYVVLAQ